MTKCELIKRLNYLGMSQKDFAEYIGYSYQAVKQWKDGKIPLWVSLVLDHFELIKNNKKLARRYGL